MEIIFSLDEIKQVAKKIILEKPHKVILFHGNMGVGKTTLIKALAKELGVTDATSSPTFSLVNEYHAEDNQKVYHFDMYRLKSEIEALDMGIEDYLYSGNWCFIEWAEKIPNLLPDDFSTIILSQSVDGKRIFTSTIQPKSLLKALRRCDVAIGAMRGKDRCPVVVTETMVEHMKKGAVIVDVSIDTGGCFETSEVTTHESPTFIKNNVIHYCVPNIPSRYSKTASLSISNIITPYLLQIAEDGGLESAIRCNKGLKNGVYLYHGILTNKAIGDWFNLPDNDINLIVF